MAAVWHPPELRQLAHVRRRNLMTQATANIQRSTSYTVEASGDLMAPSVGRVHLVGIGGMGEERDHFLTQMDADANMGAKALRQSSRKVLSATKADGRGWCRGPPTWCSGSEEKPWRSQSAAG